MPLPGVSIEIQNGALGQTPATDDAVVGLLLQGPAVSGGIQVGVPTQFTSLADAEAVGLDEAYDTTEEVRVWKHIRDFYAEAGTGAVLWVMLVSQAISMEDMVDVAEANYAKKLLDGASGAIRVLGVTRSPADGYTPSTTANQIDLDVVTAINFAQALATAYADAFTPVRVVLEARSFTGTSSTLVDLKLRDDNRVAVMLGDTVTGGGGAVGLLLGRLASDPVQRNPGRVKSGALDIETAYVGSETVEAVPAKIVQIHDKGFISLRTYPRKAGYYFTDDPTATAATDDYNSLARGRVIDKAIVLAYDVFVNEILDEVEIDTLGRIAPDKAKYYQTIIESAISQAMTAEGEISSVSALVDPAQNVLSTGEICVELRIIPVGYARTIVVKLGFNNPANS